MLNITKILIFYFLGSGLLYGQSGLLDIAEDSDSQQEQIVISSQQIDHINEVLGPLIQDLNSQFKISDSLTLLMYGLRFFAGIGEYEVYGEDLFILTKKLFEKRQKKVPENVLKLIGQISKIKFGRKKGRSFLKIYTKNLSTGLAFALEESVVMKYGSKNYLLKQFNLQNGAEIYFDDINTITKQKELIQFVKEDLSLFSSISLPSFLEISKKFSNINHGIKEGVMTYLSQKRLNHNLAPLKIEMRGVNLEVSSTGLLKKLNFEMAKAYSLPNMNDGIKRYSSMMLQGMVKFLNFKLSIDQ